MDTGKFGRDFFDRIHDRRNTGSIKYSENIIGSIDQNVIPMWVADMDFESPPAVLEAVGQVARHGIYGYTEPDVAYFDAIIAWYARRMAFTLRREWMLPIPGVTYGIAAAVRALTAPNDAVLICQPVYHPFERIIKANNRKPVVSELTLQEGTYRIDWDDFEAKIRQNSVRLFILCSPHNPIGRVWTRDELIRIGEICARHHVVIVADEIHSDFIHPGHTHTPMASIPACSDNTVTLIAPTKTFNIAGLQSAQMVIINPDLRKKLERELNATGGDELNIMAIAATAAAYRGGEAWLDGLLAYLNDNIRQLRTGLSEIEPISLIHPEGTYLMWLDCRRLALTDRELMDFFVKDAGVYLNRGSMFGTGGSGFMRMNIACPSSVLSEALERIKTAVRRRHF